MLYLFTFCVDIDHHNFNDLVKILKLFIKSLKRNKNVFELHIFTNRVIDIKEPNIIFHNYFNETNNEFTSVFYNLSFNKLYLFKYLYEKFNKNFIWMDLDTIITGNIQYLENYDNFFVENGGSCTDPWYIFRNKELNNFNVPTNQYIQGNIWKINNNIYNKLMIIYNKIIKEKLKLRYDTQDLFNYYIFKELNGKIDENQINILGRNINKNKMYGMAVWSKKGNKHAFYYGMKRLYWEKGLFKTLFYKDKSIDILSFCFYNIIKLYDENKFKRLFKKYLC